MRKTLSFVLMMAVTPLMAEDAVTESAAKISVEDCLAMAEISDLIAGLRQEGKSERRATRILTKGRRAVDDRYIAGVPTLVTYFYSLPEEAVVPGDAGDIFKASCLPKEDDAEASE
ncbi:hypothetical protein [Cognatishimia sp.]|uniref:hypothetical protein n=1 Tax=Cognatishimia sp. TaxID=2211648 RepID=UPI003515511A